MKYVILRDDDANGLTSPGVLEQLYRPFLERGMPIHLATIPEVRTDIVAPDGQLEGFLGGPDAGKPGVRPIGANTALLDYLKHEPGYRVVQHGLRHEFVEGHYEFAREDAADLRARIDRGLELLEEAGLPRPTTFVAPQDRLSRAGLTEAARTFDVISTGWYDLAKVSPWRWPSYVLAKKVRRAPHWRVGRNVFLTHPGCILSYRRDPSGIFDALQKQVLARDLTVVVSHHWEYFLGGKTNQPFIDVLHAFGNWLASEKNIRVIRFEDAADIVS